MKIAGNLESVNKNFLFSAILLSLLVFFIPIEHQFDKLFRFFSLTLIPEGVEVSHFFNKKIYFYGSDLIGLVLLFWAAARIPLKKLFGSPLWIVFLCAAASIIASPFIHYPVAYTRLFQLLTPFALFSFLAHGFTEEEIPKMTRIIFVALVVAGICQTGIAIAQYFNQSPLGLRLLSEPTSMSKFKMANGSRWIFDQFFSHEDGFRSMIRASGTLPHANVLGGFLLASLFATYALALQPRSKLIALTIPLQFFAMCISYSRSSLFAWALATIIWLGWAAIKKISNWQFVAWMIGISVGSSALLLSDQYTHRGGVINYNKLAQESDSTRLFHQRTAFKIIKDNPILGLGYSQFSERAQKYFPEESTKSVRETGPHNIYLFLACETGLVSLAAFLLFIGLILRGVMKSSFTIESVALFSIFIAFLFIGCCDFYPILFQQGKLLFFTVCGLLYGHLNRKQSLLKVFVQS